MKRDRVLFIILCVVLAAITGAVFHRVTSFDLTNLDDFDYVTQNKHVLSGMTWDTVTWAFTTTRSSNWHPVTWLSLALDCELNGLDSGALHLTNLILHIANTLLLFGLLRWLTGRTWRSVFVAALFAVHPLHVESVAWVTERKDVLSTFFWLLTIIAYALYARRPRARTYALALFAFVLGLMAKPMLVSLPIALLLMDYWPLGRFGGKGSARRLIIEKTPFIALAGASCVVTFWVQRVTGAVATLDRFGMAERLANAVISYVEYIVMMLWPARLAAYYPFPTSGLTILKVAGALALLAGITTIAFRLRRSRPYVLAGWLWYIVTLVPVIGIVQVGKQAVADRYTYVPLIGLFVIIAWGVPDILARGKGKLSNAWNVALASAGIAIVLVLGAQSCRQAETWQNSIVLFKHALAVTSHNAIAHFTLGAALSQQGDDAEALPHYIAAIRIDPNYTDAHYNLGQTYSNAGRLREAQMEFLETIRCRHDRPDAYNALGVVYMKQFKVNAAIGAFRKALQYDPNFKLARSNLDIALEQAGGGG